MNRLLKVCLLCLVVISCDDDGKNPMPMGMGGNQPGMMTPATDAMGNRFPPLGGMGGTPDAGTTASDSTWTVFVYGHADHNLSVSLFADLVEMVQARFDKNKLKLILLADWDATQRIPSMDLPFPSGSFWYQIDGSGDLEVVREGPELDLDDPQVVKESITYAITQFPADRYGVVFWNHGGGWEGGFGGDSQDNTRKGAGLGIQALAKATRQGLDAAGLTGSRPLAFMAFDTCLLAGAETFAAVADLAEVMIGAAEIDYGDGWDYEATMTWLGNNLAATAPQFATAEVAAWDAHHAEAGIDDAFLRSHAAVDLNAMDNFKEQAAKLVIAAKGMTTPVDFARAVFESVPQYFNQIAEHEFPSTLRDVGQLLRRIIARNGSLAGQAQATLDALLDMKIAGSQGQYRTGQDGVNVLGAPVMHIDAPTLQRYDVLARTWESATDWGGLFSHLHSVADVEPPTISGAVTALGPQAQPRVDFEALDADVGWAQASLLQVTSNNLDLLMMHGFLDGSFITPGKYSLSWPGEMFTLKAQPQNLPITVNPWIFTSTPNSPEIPLLAVSGVLRFSWGEELDCRLLVDTRTATGSTVVFQSGLVSSAMPLSYFKALDPDALFFPVLSFFDNVQGSFVNGKHHTGMKIPASNQLTVEAVTAPDGLYVIMLQVMDVWGVSAYDAHVVPYAAPSALQ